MTPKASLELEGYTGTLGGTRTKRRMLGEKRGDSVVVVSVTMSVTVSVTGKGTHGPHVTTRGVEPFSLQVTHSFTCGQSRMCFGTAASSPWEPGSPGVLLSITSPDVDDVDDVNDGAGAGSIASIPEPVPVTCFISAPAASTLPPLPPLLLPLRVPLPSSSSSPSARETWSWRSCWT